MPCFAAVLTCLSVGLSTHAAAEQVCQNLSQDASKGSTWACLGSVFTRTWVPCGYQKRCWERPGAQQQTDVAGRFEVTYRQHYFLSSYPQIAKFHNPE